MSETETETTALAVKRYYVVGSDDHIVANCSTIQEALRAGRAHSQGIAGRALVYERRQNGSRQLVATYRWGELQ